MTTLACLYTNTIPENKVMIHKCKKCPYITKSLFFMNNHVRRHLCTEPLALFDCSKSSLDCFICGDCDFQTHLVRTFREHIINHSVKRENGEIILKKKDTLETTNETNISENYETKPFLQINSIKSEALETASKSKHKSRISCESNKPEHLKCFQCDHCSRKFKAKGNLQLHILAKHTNSENVRRFYYDKCLPFVKQSGQQDIKQKIKWFHCDKCSFKSKWRSYLRTHNICKHTPSDEIKWFHCELCSFKAKKKISLKLHTIYNHTAVDDAMWFYCDKCPYKCKRPECLRKHIIYRHTPSDEIKWFHCDHCSHKTKTKYSLNSHKLHKHTAIDNVNWFQCYHCSYKAKKKSCLQSHIMYNHTAPESIKWFQCDRCSYKTRTSRELRSHTINKHVTPEDIKWLQCDRCSFNAKTKEYLRQHKLRKHAAAEKIKWFQCYHCSYKAKIKGNLQRHISNKHDSRK